MDELKQKIDPDRITMLMKRLARFHGRCSDATRVASDRLDGRISLRRRIGLWFHLRTCSACALAVLQMGLVRHRTGRPVIPDDVPRLTDEARARIASRIEQARG